MGVARAVPIGPTLASTIDVIRSAGLSALLRGPHGIGKSGFLVSYAQDRGMEPYLLDLSLMEPADLTGIPFLRQDGDRTITTFAAPDTLPSGQGPSALIIEELNRCDRSLRQPCLQLLSARRLNNYHLPQECFVAACINPDEGIHEVDPLDPALLSRFVVLDVVPEREAWLAWGESVGLHHGVLAFLRDQPAAFDTAPPRTWEQAGRLCTAALDAKWKATELKDLLSWILPLPAAKALVLWIQGSQVPKSIAPKRLAAAPLDHAATFEIWRERGRLDLVHATLEALAAHLRTRPRLSVDAREALRMLIVDYVPPDLAAPALEVLEL